VYQVEVLLLYTAGFTLLLLGDAGLEEYLSGGQYQLPGGMPVILVSFLVGACFFFFGLVSSVNASITSVLKRMGAERPKPLAMSDSGNGWTVPGTATCDSSLLVGDIEIALGSEKEQEEAKKQAHREDNCCIDLILVSLLGIPRSSLSVVSASASGEHHPA
jgi:hypothetical protein